MAELVKLAGNAGEGACGPQIFMGIPGDETA